MHEAQEVCDRIAVLNNRLITVTTPKKLMDDMEKANLEEAFIALLKDEMESKPAPAGGPPMG
jgi:ABC-type Na+ transport system ATPase subunit NatA